MINPNLPLTKDHEKLVDYHLQELSKLSEMFGRCDSCGITPDGLKEDWQYLIGQLTAIKQNFFTPGGYVANGS